MAYVSTDLADRVLRPLTTRFVDAAHTMAHRIENAHLNLACQVIEKLASELNLDIALSKGDTSASKNEIKAAAIDVYVHLRADLFNSSFNVRALGEAQDRAQHRQYTRMFRDLMAVCTPLGIDLEHDNHAQERARVAIATSGRATRPAPAD